MDKIILLVEDNPDDEALTLRAVRQNLSSVVVVTRDGSEALDFLFGTGDYEGRDLSINPSLIILDLKLPKLNGFEVLRHIRKDIRTCCIPVVMFSSSTEERDIFDSYWLGANSYLCKPVAYHEFCDTLKQVMAYWLHLNRQPSQWKALSVLDIDGYDVSVNLPKASPHTSVVQADPEVPIMPLPTNTGPIWRHRFT